MCKDVKDGWGGVSVDVKVLLVVDEGWKSRLVRSIIRPFPLFSDRATLSVCKAVKPGQNRRSQDARSPVALDGSLDQMLLSSSIGLACFVTLLFAPLFLWRKSRDLGQTTHDGFNSTAL
jgi:hypothetical protein